MIVDSLKDFTDSYIVAALWSSQDGSGKGEFLDENYSQDDIAEEAMQQIQADCRAFFLENEADINLLADQAGHDFWLTRNGHGTGFWDREDIYGKLSEKLTEATKKFKPVDLYVGDDGLIYQE